MNFRLTLLLALFLPNLPVFADATFTETQAPNITNATIFNNYLYVSGNYASASGMFRMPITGGFLNNGELAVIGGVIVNTPVIVTQPASISVPVGDQATLSITASDATSYQWSLNGQPLVDSPTINGSITPTLTLAAVTPTSAGSYTVTVTNSYGSVTSSAATLTVLTGAPTYVFKTLAGIAGVTGNADGTGGSAQFSSPRGTAVDASGNVYVADTNNSIIRKITPAGVV